MSIFSSAMLSAEVAGRLTGSVVDPSGPASPAQPSAFTCPGGSTPVLTAKTSSDGIFDFTAVRPDTYNVTVEMSGFNKFSENNVKVDPVRQTTLQSITLQLQAAAQSIEVSAAAPGVDTSSVEVANTVTQAQVLNLPVHRQVNNLFYTQPGVNSNGRADTAINGVRAQNTNVTLDGVNIQDNFIRINGLDYLPNKLTIGEVSGDYRLQFECQPDCRRQCQRDQPLHSVGHQPVSRQCLLVQPQQRLLGQRLV